MSSFFIFFVDCGCFDLLNNLIVCLNAHSLTFIQQVFVNPVGICWSLSIRETFGRAFLVAGVRENDIDIIDIASLRTLSSMGIDRWAYRP